MVGYIYRITNIQTNKVYVGITEDYERRRKKHISELKNHCHHSYKLQKAWDEYGENNFEFTYRIVEINSYDDLYNLEIAEIARFNSFNDGYNCNAGGRVSDWKQKVKNEDIIKFLCIQWKYGNGYGKTAEDIFGWSRGTASAAKRKTRFVDANCKFEKLSDEERDIIAVETYENYHFKEKALERQLTQGGCAKSYSLIQEDYNFAFCAQELGFKAPEVAKYFGVKECTVYDWFNHRSRRKEYAVYLKLNSEEKSRLTGRVKTAELNGKP